MRVTLFDWCTEKSKTELLLEWDGAKNIDVTPKTVTAMSNRKVYWRCSQGHIWQSAISNRTAGQSRCPYCSGRKRIVGKNDIKTLYPEIYAEWDVTKNPDISLDSIPLYSKRKFWWKCSFCGYSWEAQIANRTKLHSGCPKCSSRLQTSFPEQAVFYYIQLKYPDALNRYTGIENTELDIYIPSFQIAIEYDGIQWHNSNASHIKEQKKYTVCKNHNIKLIRIKEAVNDPAENTCDLLIRITKSLDEAIVELSNELNLNCDINTIRDRIPILEQYKTAIKATSIETLYPELSDEWHPTKNGSLRPYMFQPNSHFSVWWLCSKGHEWQTSVETRTKGGDCPYCSNNLVLKGFNDLASTAPKLAAEWHPTKNGELKATDVTDGSNLLVWWQCSKGHEWKQKPNNRKFHDLGCPYCANKKVWVGYNDLATTRPELAMEWHPTKNDTLTPQSVTSGSAKKVWWLCRKQHEWYASIALRAEGSGCPYCANQKVLTGFNDLKTLCPTLALEWHPTKNLPLTPDKITPGSLKKVWWKCSRGHEWMAMVVNRSKNESKCPACSRRTPPEVFEQQLKQKNPNIIPLETYSCNNVAIRLKCNKCNAVWIKQPQYILRDPRCPKCQATPRYKRTAASLEQELLQIGIDVSILDKYQGIHTKIQVKCNKCGQIYKIAPHELLRGEKCKNCR